ncbi:WecB/TagA/CpsF family glycosyltransferase [Anaerospora hongkongensis]|uniref:WecB/TagA/CpsF family glycosyltransferase n=1 Tax=Anaerospora hongkongensis TaxID=244830 RepID=UPI00289B77CD|nr:WecB/TagA/CpsF family glycosyltransferase [Anaerospora hongkongensis]
MQAKVNVLGIPVDSITMESAVAKIEAFIQEASPHLIATANAEMVMLAQQDNELSNILQHASLVVPDGAGVVWAARYQGNEVRERVAGFDLTQRLLAEAAIKGYRVYFFGAGPGIAEQAKQTAEARYPGIHIVKTRDGYFTEADEAEIIEDIVSMQPHILLAALGVPKQEKWLMRNLNKLQVPVAIGVGGTLDVMAGTVKRAPLWMQQANLEWLYRLLKQPQRAIRMLALPRFVLKVIMDKK